MAILRVSVIVPNDSGLSEDQAINNFSFSTGDTASGTLDAIVAALDAFYNDPVAPSVNPVTDFLSDFLDGANGRIKIVNMSDPKPRFPIRDQAFPLTIPAGNGFPNEVSIRLSWEGAKVAGEDQARKRGGVFIGPVKSSVGAAGTGDYRVSAAVQTVLNNAAKRLSEASEAAALWTWVVHSAGARDNSDDTIPYKERPLLPEAFTPVVKGWCDDSFDTQRRRGRKASARASWTVAPA